MKKFNKQNCSSELRAQITDKWGRTISLFGTHAFEWSIYIESDGKLTAQTYTKGSTARGEFHKLTKKK